MSDTAAPTFDEAKVILAARLEGAGWPSEIVWIWPGDVTRATGPDWTVYLRLEDERNAMAARDYENARAAGRGVVLTAVCTLAELTCVTVDDARGGGLSISIPEVRVEGSARWPAC